MSCSYTRSVHACACLSLIFMQDLRKFPPHKVDIHLKLFMLSYRFDVHQPVLDG